MKIESQVSIASQNSVFEVYPDGGECAALFYDGRKILSIGRIRTGNFDESLGLVEKLRKHMAADMLSAEVDSANVIPFGCEYHVKRHWKFSGNCGEVTDDINADNGGRINDLALENILFCGKPEKVEYLLAGENEVRSAAGGKIYDGEKLPLFVRVTFADDVKAEVYCGDDFWRHECAGSFAGGAAHHVICCDDEGVHWERKVLTLPEECVPEKRPWRFKTVFSAGKAVCCEHNSAAEFSLQGCFAAPAKHREFRDFIRKQPAGTDVRLKISGDICCFDGSHVSRPQKSIAHGMLGELFDEYIWASTFLHRKGGRFTLDIGGSALADSPAAANFRVPAPVLSAGETEDGSWA